MSELTMDAVIFEPEIPYIPEIDDFKDDPVTINEIYHIDYE